MLTDPQVRALTSDLVAQALVRMSDPEPERRAALKAAISSWLPDADEFLLRDVTRKVAECMQGLAVLVDERKNRQLDSGQAADYG